MQQYAGSAVVLDVLLGVLVLRNNPGRRLLRLEAQEPHRDGVPLGEADVLPEVGEVLALLLSPVVAVGDPAVDDCLPPAVAAGVVLANLADGIADLVVVPDRVLDLLVGVRASAAPLSSTYGRSSSSGCRSSVGS
jgi:hypothetical protein